MALTDTPRWPIGLLALGYLVFAVYGSLVPLNYQPLPWDEAVARFRDIPFLRLGIGSRADWVANVLLFIPLTFLWLGWLWPGSTWGRIFISALVWIAALALCIGIEFTQLHFPPRTVSQNDILAETLGGLIGIGLWWWKGPALWLWVNRWREARGVTSVAEYLLWVYLAGMFLYNILPLDLTISPVEIFRKWKDGGVNLIPFAYPVEGPVQLVYATAVDAVLWLPVSLLWVLSGRRSPVQAFWWALGAAALLELFQFFVVSRVSDITDLITAASGAGIGALIGARLAPALFAADQEGTAVGAAARARNLLPWLLLASAAWTCLLCAVFWYPYELDMERGFLRERLSLLTRVPLRNYYYGTEFRAVTELFHKLLFPAPLGALLALARLQIRRFSPWRGIFTLFAMLLIISVPLGLELGQVAMPSKHPDSTDWVLMAMGGAGGFVLVNLVRNRILLSRRPAAPRAAAGEGRTG
jgi:glycopeptide antibiotics resistance protein